MAGLASHCFLRPREVRGVAEATLPFSALTAGAFKPMRCEGRAPHHRAGPRRKTGCDVEENQRRGLRHRQRDPLPTGACQFRSGRFVRHLAQPAATPTGGGKGSFSVEAATGRAERSCGRLPRHHWLGRTGQPLVLPSDHSRIRRRTRTCFPDCWRACRLVA